MLGIEAEGYMCTCTITNMYPFPMNKLLEGNLTSVRYYKLHGRQRRSKLLYATYGLKPSLIIIHQITIESTLKYLPVFYVSGSDSALKKSSSSIVFRVLVWWSPPVSLSFFDVGLLLLFDNLVVGSRVFSFVSDVSPCSMSSSGVILSSPSSICSLIRLRKDSLRSFVSFPDVSSLSSAAGNSDMYFSNFG